MHFSCTHERFVELFLLPLKEVSAEELQIIPQEHCPDRIAKQMADISFLPGTEEIVPVVHEAVTLIPQERVQQRVVEHAPIPQFREEAAEVERLHPFERVQQWTLEQIGDLLQFAEKTSRR